MTPVSDFFAHISYRSKLEKDAFFFYIAANLFAILLAVISIINGTWDSFKLCLVTMALLTLPTIIPYIFKMYVPPFFRIILYIFIICTEILGEVLHFYALISGWDSIFHTLSGFLCGAFGMALIYILNRKKKVDLSPITIALFAIGITLLIGIGWEIFEFTMDQCGLFDMQKDFIVPNIGSIKLDETGQGQSQRIYDITRTIIETKSGSQYIVQGGYLDIGIDDTMKDIIVNLIGAGIFGTLAVIGLKRKKTNNFISDHLFIVPVDWSEMNDHVKKRAEEHHIYNT